MFILGDTGGGRLKPITQDRLAINQLFQGAPTVPQVSSTVDVDMTRTVALRDRAGQVFQQMTGLKLGLMPFFVKAAARGLHACPEANATLTPDGLWLHNRIRMGISIPTPDGVIMPVLHDPDHKSITQIAREIEAFARRGHLGQIGLHEINGSTFGVTNSGTLGIRRDVPMVIPPHTAVLACAAVVQRPVALHGWVSVRPVMEATLSFDHRALDGEGAKRFFDAFRSCLERAQYA
jgi:pyruvate/2-oxoglutarate dehydrogenase complex dihydrolipoamide acyltransferase (E2) component